MMTRYVGARVSRSLLMPIIVGTWPAAMLIADPVMNAVIEVSEIKSTIHPIRSRPIVTMIAPQSTANAEAITCPGIVGSMAFALITTLPTIVDMTATGCFRSQHSPKIQGEEGYRTPIVISFEVAKNQYIRTPMKEEYKPN